MILKQSMNKTILKILYIQIQTMIKKFNCQREQIIKKYPTKLYKVQTRIVHLIKIIIIKFIKEV